MTVTPYTDPQIDPTVAQPWPSQVNAALAAHDQDIVALRGYVNGLAATINELHSELNRASNAIFSLLSRVSFLEEELDGLNSLTGPDDADPIPLVEIIRYAADAIRNPQSAFPIPQ